jgi:hypothetical protein
LRQHASQFLDGRDPTERIRAWAMTAGQAVGVPFAEGFRRFVLERVPEE